jgi:hypothetical protein
MPTVAERVNKEITQMARRPVCDHCLADKLNLRSAQHAQQITVALGTTTDFVRGKAECSLCQRHRTTIRLA